MSGPVSDMLAVAQALARSKEADDALKEALSKLDRSIVEQNTALADVVDALEKSGSAGIDHEALGKSMAAAFVVAIKNMPAPIVKVDVPAQQGAAKWEIKTPKGETYTLTRK